MPPSDSARSTQPSLRASDFQARGRPVRNSRPAQLHLFVASEIRISPSPPAPVFSRRKRLPFAAWKGSNPTRLPIPESTHSTRLHGLHRPFFLLRSEEHTSEL